MKKTLTVGTLGILLFLLLSACGINEKKEVSSEKEKLQFVTTFYPIYDFTKNIVGDQAEVKLLIPAGTEPHDYEPSAKDMASIMDADAFIYHNENMEMWVPKASEGWKKGQPAIIKGTQSMILLPGNEDEHNHGEEDEHSREDHHHELDPHTWVSPNMAIKEVTSLKNQLVELYPEKKKIFETNTENYLVKLKELDKRYSDSLSQAKQKSFVTQHAAFGYLALDYGLTQIPISGITPDQEPNAARIAELKHYVEDNGIQYIYFEKNATDKIAKTLAEEAKVQLAVLNPLESLTKDQIDNGENYLSVMEQNLLALEKTTKQSGKEIHPETTDPHDNQSVSSGYFEDEQVTDRPLSDYAGSWQSVYPLLKNGDLDEVFDYKAKQTKEKTATEYKDYYETGYKTNVDELTIDDHHIDFIVDGKHHSFEYTYKGYEILTYKKGNRGVRFLFETADKEAGDYKYVQFSDHGISPNKAAHFHIYYGGTSQEALFDQLENWPTYYPSKLSSQKVAQEMLAH